MIRCPIEYDLPSRRRALLQLASQLPDQTESARIILQLTTELLDNFLDEPKPTEKPSPVVIVGGRNLTVP
jgi:hypothetical protein